MIPPQGVDAWHVERYQRDAIVKGLPSDVRPEDILIVSDVDEIPNPQAVVFLRQQPSPLTVELAFNMDFYYYDLEHMKKDPWFLARATSATTELRPSQIRQARGQLIPVHGGVASELLHVA